MSAKATMPCTHVYLSFTNCMASSTVATVTMGRMGPNSSSSISLSSAATWETTVGETYLGGVCVCVYMCVCECVCECVCVCVCV